jgi:hypothetical protein
MLTLGVYERVNTNDIAFEVVAANGTPYEAAQLIQADSIPLLDHDGNVANGFSFTWNAIDSRLEMHLDSTPADNEIYFLAPWTTELRGPNGEWFSAVVFDVGEEP